MICTVEGHQYKLANMDNTNVFQDLIFITKEPTDKATPELVTTVDGTTNEEVLAMLIDRMKYLQNMFPCRENAIVITKLEESLMWLEKRTKDRLNRGVEGKYIK